MNQNQRPIRSFVRREGRLTKSQNEALKNLWPEFGLSTAMGMLDFKKIFGRESDVILEIGFGMGDSLAQMALEHPDWNYLGVEVHRPGIGALLQKIQEQKIPNIRIFGEDVMQVIDLSLPDDSLSAVQIYFPDPWPKTRHHKRRLIQEEFIEKLNRKLKLAGKIHLATDWEDYAEQMMQVIQHCGLNNLAGSGNYIENKGLRPMTKFEKSGLKLGHQVWDLAFIKV